MTPKEKAKELVNKMSSSIEGIGWEEMAKQCAIIAVDETLDILTFDLGHDQTARKLEEHWQQVKTELLNL